MLSPDYPLHQLTEYLVKTTQFSLHNHRDTLFLRNVKKIENLQVRYRLSQYVWPPWVPLC
jgi:hypothetical protein